MSYIQPRVFTRLNVELFSTPKILPSNDQMRMLNVAADCCCKSQHPIHKMGCGIFSSKGKLIATGWNEPKTHPFQSKNNPHSPYLHAEMKALLRAMKKTEFDPTTSYISVVRISRTGLRSCSYPCTHCWTVLEDVGFRKVLCYDAFDLPSFIEV